MTARHRSGAEHTRADLSALLGVGPLGDALAEIVRLVAPDEVVPGWATVELERAAQAVLPVPTPSSDELLGAKTVVVGLERGRRVVLLEPSTEGPLAAALARHGEGWIAAYLRAPEPPAGYALRAAGFSLSPEAPGPLGLQRRVLVGPRDGPFVLLVRDD
jgi:hypothetical protein